MAPAARYLTAIDLGGTKILCAILERSGKIVHRIKKQSPAGSGGGDIMELMKSMIRQAHAKKGLKASASLGIAVGVPGVVEPKTGIVRNTPNLGFVNFPLKAILRRTFKVPVVVENDVNAGTWGEYCFGPVGVHRNVIGVFPGTGIGGGLILERQLYRGSTGGAGEIGHMIIQTDGPRCGCGQFGCVEALSSRSALSREAVFFASTGGAPTVLKDAGTDYRQVKSKALFSAYRAGDPAIVALVDKSIVHLGVALANCVNLFNPDAIVIGGGLVEKFGVPYIKALRVAVRAHAMTSLVSKVKIYSASLKDDAVVRGAGALLLDSLKKKN